MWRLALVIICVSLPFGGAPAQVLQLGNQTVNLATLPLVPPEAVPSFGRFSSAHRPGGPPLPGLPPAYAAAGLPGYWLSGHRYLIDDTGLDWAALHARQQLAQAAAELQVRVHITRHTGLRACLKTQERGCVVLDQPQQRPISQRSQPCFTCCGWSATQPRSVFKERFHS